MSCQIEMWYVRWNITFGVDGTKNSAITSWSPYDGLPFAKQMRVVSCSLTKLSSWKRKEKKS